MSSPTETPAAAAPAAIDQIEVDDADTYSAYAESALTDTTSLRSSIMKYKLENGRRYHSETAHEGLYWGPNDEKQQEAEDLSHQMYTLIIGGLRKAPINEPERVLDVGCGTGAWVIYFADENSSSEVTGMDISLIQPDFVPPNARFEVDDINKPWTYPKNHFDYVHHASGGASAKWAAFYDEIGEKLGVTFRAAEASCQAMKDAGFTNVAERVVKLPVGPWAKDKQLKAWGGWFGYFVLEGLEGFVLRMFTEVLEWSYEEAQIYIAQVRKEIKDPQIHIYVEMRIVHGQKPS